MKHCDPKPRSPNATCAIPHMCHTTHQNNKAVNTLLKKLPRGLVEFVEVQCWLVSKIKSQKMSTIRSTNDLQGQTSVDIWYEKHCLPDKSIIRETDGNRRSLQRVCCITFKESSDERVKVSGGQCTQDAV